MKVFNNIDVNPTDMNLYITAVTHSSYTNENPNYPDYERLEFLGDAVLEIIISDYLYKERKYEEGIMTKMRASYVCEEACATYAKEMGLDEDIKVGSGEEVNQTILADVFEIIVKYIDRGENFLHDYKSTLQELVQTVKKSVTYEVIDEEGPSHNKTFTSIVKIDGIVMGKGTAGSKKASEQEAARDALSKRSEIN